MDPMSLVDLGLSAYELYGNKREAYGAAKGMDNSAELYDLQAKSIIANAEYAVRRGEEQGRREMGTYVARFAKAGVRFEGTPAISIAESERNIRLDMLATRLNAAAKANELGFKGMNQRISASILRMKASHEMSTGLLKLGTEFVMNNTGGNTQKNAKAMNGGNVSEMSFGKGASGFNQAAGVKSSALNSSYTNSSLFIPF